jgi:hypothetical protein
MCGQVRRKCAAVGMLVRSWLSGSEEPGPRPEELCEVPSMLLEALREVLRV